MRKVDVSHSGQTVVEAIEQLRTAIETARRDGERLLLIIHGFGASGTGGAIKAGLVSELPRLARTYGFKAYSDIDRIPRQEELILPRLNRGSTLIIFPKVGVDRESQPDFRPNFRNLRSRVKVRRVTPASPTSPDRCGHAKRQLLSSGPHGYEYKCRRCGKRFLVPRSSQGTSG